MTEESKEEQVTEKSKGPLFWLIMILVLMLTLGLFCCGIGNFFLSSVLDSDEFVEAYCESFVDQGRHPSEDPFGLCHDYRLVE